MLKFYGNCLALFLSLFFTGLNAQSCAYQLETFSSFGNGWNNGSVTISTGSGTAGTMYALTPDLDDGTVFTFCVPVAVEDSIYLTYNPGFFDNSVGFRLLDFDGDILLSVELGNVTQGVLYGDTVSCPACQTPTVCEDIGTQRLRSTSVELLYNAVGLDSSGNEPLYLVEYGPPGFIPGTGTFQTTTDTIFRLQPLVENTPYDIYVSTICFEGQDTSASVGPVSIFTPFTRDVGASELSMPVSGCYLSFEEIEIGLTNFGGAPQTFIPFNYSINGVLGDVNMPADGLYTGVLGVDSTEFTSFDSEVDFSAPGEYILEFWTELEGDSLSANDTVTVTVFSAPNITTYPYYEDYEENDGFWSDQEFTGTLSSWQYGPPNGAVINSAASGDNAWVTKLDGAYPDSELSYLYSPCFDLSDETRDPILSFALFNNFGTGIDGLQLEATTNNQDYFLIGAPGDGLNWYNDAFNNWWDNVFNATPAWETSAIKLDDFAGEPTVRFRFRFETGTFGVNNDGVAIDNFLLTPQPEKELTGLNVNGPQDQFCGTPEDQATITFFNLGDTTADDIQLSYQVNGGNIVTESFPDTLGSFEQATYTFAATYDGTIAAVNEIVAWVSLTGDDFPLNDTVRTSIIVRGELPLYEDFEESLAGIANWQTDAIIGQDHNSGSTVLYSNLYNGNLTSLTTTSAYGAIQEGDSLAFDYRFVNFAAGTAGTVLATGDSLSVGLIIGCNEVVLPFFSITSENHITSAGYARVSMALPPESYGTDIQIVFSGVNDPNAFTDFFLDIDNINIKRCAASFDLTGSIFNPADTSETGSITVNANEGLAPFTYEWDSGETTATINGLDPGSYTVTVTDVQGCTDVATFTVIISDVTETITALNNLEVFPNPTSGNVQLRLELPTERNVQVVVFNQYGQRLISKDFGRQSRLNEAFDLTAQPAGIYFLRLFSEGEQRTVRVVKTR